MKVMQKAWLPILKEKYRKCTCLNIKTLIFAQQIILKTLNNNI